MLFWEKPAQKFLQFNNNLYFCCRITIRCLMVFSQIEQTKDKSRWDDLLGVFIT